MGYSWQVDETYVKVKGKWAYLYRPIDKHVYRINFYLSPMHNIRAFNCFLSEVLKYIRSLTHPRQSLQIRGRFSTLL